MSMDQVPPPISASEIKTRLNRVRRIAQQFGFVNVLEQRLRRSVFKNDGSYPIGRCGRYSRRRQCAERMAVQHHRFFKMACQQRQCILNVIDNVIAFRGRSGRGRENRQRTASGASIPTTSASGIPASSA